MILSKISLPLITPDADLRVYQVKELSCIPLGNLDVLSTRDRDRYERIIPPLKTLFYAQRLAIQMILKEVYGYHQTPILTYDDHHKPFLKGSADYISLAHSKDCLVMGFSKNPIGVDLEWMRPESSFDYQRFAHRFFTKKEGEFLNLLPKEEQNVMFYKLWTVKEARYKCTNDSIFSCALPALKTAVFKEEDHFMVCVYPYSKSNT